MKNLTMLLGLSSILVACGEKEADTATEDTAVTEEDTAVSEEETAEDTGTDESSSPTSTSLGFL